MPHLEDGTLHALLDGEIPSAELPPIEAHLAGCGECRARLEAERAIRGEADGLVEAIEAPAPGVARATAAPRATPARQPRRRLHDLAWAASVVLAAGLGYASRGGGPPVSSSQAAARRDAPLPTAEASGVVAPAPAPAEAAKQTVEAQSAPADRTELRKGLPPVRRAAAPKPAEERKALADALDSAPRAKAALAAPRDAGRLSSADEVGAERLRVPPAPAASAQAAAGGSIAMNLRGARRPDTTGVRREQFAASDLAANATKALAPAAITFPDAIARLGGTIRLIEGLVPLRVEALGDRVRVIYPLASGELVLEQWRSAAGVTWKISAPAGFPTDSVERLTARVRE